GTIELQRVEHRQHIVTQPVGVISGSWNAGGAEATPGNAVHVIDSGQLQGEVVEDMGGAAEPCQEHNRPSGSTPIEYFQPHVAVGGDELRLVGRGVAPVREGLRSDWSQQVREEDSAPP